ncbi:MAG: MlaD family protein [Polyangiaceae bacterium]
MLRPLIMVTSREIKVGAFVLVGMVLLGLVIFMIGDERQLFDKRVAYQAIFDDIDGLKRGSTIRMGGMDIGSVDKVGFSNDAGDPRLYVTLSIIESQAARIRRDSRAKIDAKGLLGDKMVTVLAGSMKEPALAPGRIIPADRARRISRRHWARSAVSRARPIKSSRISKP